MNRDLQHIFDTTADDEARSRLEPYRELILRWRRQGRSYRRIRQLLATSCKVTIARSTLHEFVQRRSRSRTDTPAPVQPAPPNQIERKPMAGGEEKLIPRRSPEEIAAMRTAASAANHKPVFQPEEPPKRFEYDPERP